MRRRLLPVGAHARAVVGVHRVEPAVAEVLLLTLSRESLPRRLRSGEPTLRIRPPGHVGDNGDERAEALLGTFPLGDVDPGRVQEAHLAELVADRVHGEVDDPLGAVGHPVAQRLAEDPACAQPPRRKADTRLHLLGAAPPGRLPERQVEHLVARVAARLDREGVDLAKVPSRSRIPAKIPDWLKTDSNFAVAATSCLLGLLAGRDVAGDLRRADDLALARS